MKRLSLIVVALLMIGLTVGPVLAAGVVQFRGIGPGRVFMQHLGNDTCAELSDNESQNFMAQTLTLIRKSHLFVTFTFGWGSLDVGDEGVMSLILDGTFPADLPGWSFTGTAISRTSGTVTWSFADVPPGTHTVEAHARVDGGDGSAQLSNCAMTVMTILPT